MSETIEERLEQLRIKAQHQKKIELLHKDIKKKDKEIKRLESEVGKGYNQINGVKILKKDLKIVQHLGLNYDKEYKGDSNGFFTIYHGRVDSLTKRDSSIRIFPKIITDLDELESLNLNHNQLERVNEDLGDLIKLKQVYFYHNKIGYIPETIGNLISLKEADFGSNNLGFLPENIGNLENLEFLYLDGNQIKELPANLYDLENLKVITINRKHLDKKSKELLQELKEKNVKIYNSRPYVK